jgi:hypothetical protein
MPTKVWAIGEEVLSADFNPMVQEQVVATFANAAARTAGIVTPRIGQITALQDVKSLWLWDGTAWKSLPKGRLGFAWVPTGFVQAGATATEVLRITLNLAESRVIQVTGYANTTQVTTAATTAYARLNVASATTSFLYGSAAINEQKVGSIAIDTVLPAGTSVILLEAYANAGATRVNTPTQLAAYDMGAP